LPVTLPLRSRSNTSKMLRVALFAALINVAFGAWTLKTSGVSTDLEEVACYGSACWTVGDGGIILKSTDCGSTWSPQTSGVTVDLKSIAAKSATDAIAVGKEGVIISTTDGGTTWVARTSGLPSACDQYSSTPCSFSDVAMLGTNAWAVTGSTSCPTSTTCSGSDNFLKSTDSGATWSLHDSFGPDSATFVSDTHGWGCRDAGFISVTTDGATWSQQTTGTTTDFKAIHAVDSSTVWAVGSGGLVMKTVDGGSTWTLQADGLTTSKLYAMAFGDTSNGWATGSDGTIIGTTNGGTEWTIETSPLTSTQKSKGLASCCTTGGSKAVLVGNGGVVANNDGTCVSEAPTASGNTATSAAISVFLGVVCTLLNLMFC